MQMIHVHVKNFISIFMGTLYTFSTCFSSIIFSNWHVMFVNYFFYYTFNLFSCPRNWSSNSSFIFHSHLESMIYLTISHRKKAIFYNATIISCLFNVWEWKLTMLRYPNVTIINLSLVSNIDFPIMSVTVLSVLFSSDK